MRFRDKVLAFNNALANQPMYQGPDGQPVLELPEEPEEDPEKKEEKEATSDV